ncbi:MAG: PIN domain protein [Bacteroidetes bacterium]|nr:PIN domain protein [Bacteroidota bacterium]MBS1757580.1 PIN domain protein [Bacteroidota bacterium]
MDTSVFGGFFEPEFELWTKVLFDKISKGEFKVLISRLTDIELENAPQQVKNLANSLQQDNIEWLDITNEAVLLADKYIAEKVVGQTSHSDCIHIALATLNYADVLVSWNFKHIVNHLRIRGYNAVNFKYGHKILDIRLPRENLDYED